MIAGGVLATAAAGTVAQGARAQRRERRPPTGQPAGPRADLASPKVLAAVARPLRAPVPLLRGLLPRPPERRLLLRPLRPRLRPARRLPLGSPPAGLAPRPSSGRRRWSSSLFGFWEYASAASDLEPRGDPVERLPHLLPGQLAVLGPEHLRPLPGAVITALVAALLWVRGQRPRPLARRPRSRVLWLGLVTTFSQSSFAALLAGLAVLAALRWSLRWTLAGLRRRGAGRRCALRPRGGRIAEDRPLDRAEAQQGHRRPRQPGQRGASSCSATGRCGATARARSRSPTRSSAAAAAAPLTSLAHRAGHGRRRAGPDRPRRLPRAARRRVLDPAAGHARA